MQLPTGKFTGKEKQWLLTRGAVTVNVKLMPHKSPLSSAVLPSRGNIKRDESHYSFVLAQLGVNKMWWIQGRQGELGEWQIDMFQHFKIPHWNHRMLFIGVTGECVWMAVTCVRKQIDPSGDARTEAKWKAYWKANDMPIVLHWILIFSVLVLIKWTKKSIDQKHVQVRWL